MNDKIKICECSECDKKIDEDNQYVVIEKEECYHLCSVDCLLLDIIKSNFCCLDCFNNRMKNLIEPKIKKWAEAQKED